MKITTEITDVGPEHSRWKLEEDCEIGDVEKVMTTMQQKIEALTGCASKPVQPPHQNPVLESSHTSKPADRVELPPAPEDKNFIPASEAARNALYGAAMRNGTDVESVCKEYGVDPNHISRRECWEMLQELNKKSGYDKIQEAKQGNDYPKEPRYPRSDRYPDDSDVFGNQ